MNELTNYPHIIQNKYLIWYQAIIKNAEHRTKKDKKTTYLELHHILPKSMGGSNKKTNLVYLTAKEHYVAHNLLTRFTVDTDLMKMQRAFRFFIFNFNAGVKMFDFFTANKFSEMRELQVQLLSEESKGEKNWFYGKKVPKEKALHNAAIRRANGGYDSEIHRRAQANIPQELRVKSKAQARATYAASGARERESERMKKNNPMHNEEVMRRGVETRAKYYESAAFRYKCVMDLAKKYGYEDANRFVCDFRLLQSTLIQYQQQCKISKERINFEPFLLNFHPEMIYHKYQIVIATVDKLMACLEKE